jgi:hypothetical protein
MRRVASHYLFWHRLYRMYYVQLDENGTFVGVYPLDAEIAGTEFYDGMIIPVLPGADFFTGHSFSFPLQSNSTSTAMEILTHKLEGEQVSEGVNPDVPVQLILLSDITLTTAEFGTNHSCCNGNVKRL